MCSKALLQSKGNRTLKAEAGHLRLKQLKFKWDCSFLLKEFQFLYLRRIFISLVKHRLYSVQLRLQVNAEIAGKCTWIH